MDNVENLTLTGQGNINGTGNELDNVITGNHRDNILTVTARLAVEFSGRQASAVSLAVPDATTGCART